MKFLHIPHIVLALIFALVVLTFLTGALYTFAPAHAALVTTAPASGQPGINANHTPIPVSAPIPTSADTTGIIALAIVIVVIVLIGAIWGRRKPYKKGSSRN